MDLVQVDIVGAQAPQAVFQRGPGPAGAIATTPDFAVGMGPEFGRYQHLVTSAASQRPAEDLLGGAQPPRSVGSA